MMETLIPLPYRIADTSRLHYAETGISPHSETERVRWTVPSNCYGKLQHAYLRVRRATAASTGGTVRARIEVLHDGTTVNYVLEVRMVDNTVNATQFQVLGLEIWMLPGDAVRIVTSDDSTGGTIDYFAYVNYALVV
ncbi:hypothetical protein [Thermofilum sp.]|uniref:hypothetical protein n=1 Tax=Thermofilum sp. TaxID=1961369 RepID=UPI00319E77B3